MEGRYFGLTCDYDFCCGYVCYEYCLKKGLALESVFLFIYVDVDVWKVWSFGRGCIVIQWLGLEVIIRKGFQLSFCFIFEFN